MQANGHCEKSINECRFACFVAKMVFFIEYENKKKQFFGPLMKPEMLQKFLIEMIVLKRGTFCIFLRVKHPINEKKINAKESATKELEKIGCSEISRNVKNNFRIEMRI